MRLGQEGTGVRGGDSLPADSSDLLVAESDTDSTAGGDGNPPVMNCSENGFLVVIKMTGLSISGAAAPSPLECVVKILCSERWPNKID